MTGAVPARRRRILAAENDPAHQLVLGRVFRSVRESPEISFVNNGREMLATLAAGARPDMIMLDLHMPLLGGLDTVAAIRRDPGLCLLPVVMLSSSDAERHVEAAYRNGANAYLVKCGEWPRLLDQMERCVAFWMGAARLPGQRAA